MPNAVELHAAFSKFVAVAMCCKRNNTKEFMKYLGEQINISLAVLGIDDRVEEEAGGFVISKRDGET